MGIEGLVSSDSGDLIHSEGSNILILDFANQLLVLAGPEERDQSGALLDVVDFVVSSEAGTFLGRSNLEDNVSSKGFFGGSDFSTGVDVLLISDGGTLSSSFFDDKAGSILLGHFLDGFRSDGNSGLIFLNFLGDTDEDILGINSEGISGSGHGGQRGKSSGEHI